MLIENVWKKHGIVPRGIIHIGANECQEKELYNNSGVTDDCILWIEAIPKLVEKMKSLHPHINIVQALVSDTDNELKKFNISNNDAQSSSFLNLDFHKIAHPEVYNIDEIQLYTTTLESLLRVNKIDASKFDTLVMDIQGAELHALKGMTKMIKGFKFIYLEVNERSLYQGCGLLPEVDAFLNSYNFTRIDTVMTHFGWGDALYKRLHIL